MRFVIGAMGKPCAGKGTVYTLLREEIEMVCKKEISIISARFSDMLREEATQHNLPHTRDVLQCLAQEMEEHAIARGEGPGALSRKMSAYVAILLDNYEIVYVDGVRWKSDCEMIRSSNPRGCTVLLYIKRALWRRYRACRERGQNEGDREKTRAQFKEEDNAPNERYIYTLAREADMVFDNNGSLEDLRAQVKLFAKCYIPLSYFS